MRWYDANFGPDLAAAYSAEWLSTWPYVDAQSYMIFQVCADESYRLDGRRARVVVIAGWLSTPDIFKRFGPDWKAVLNLHHVEYFHFQEFADRKHHRNFEKTIYDGLNDLEAENLLYDLALAAFDVGVPVGAAVAPRSATDTKSKLITQSYQWFFSSVRRVIESTVMRQTFDAVNTADFIFDENDDPAWQKAMREEYKSIKDAGAPFGHSGTQDDKIFLPLQAADLYAYAMRQNAERYFTQDKTRQNARLLDLILEKNRIDLENWNVRSQNWGQLMREVIAHSREWKQKNPSTVYHPLIHCPFLKQK